MDTQRIDEIVEEIKNETGWSRLRIAYELRNSILLYGYTSDEQSLTKLLEDSKRKVEHPKYLEEMIISRWKRQNVKGAIVDVDKALSDIQEKMGWSVFEVFLAISAIQATDKLPPSDLDALRDIHENWEYYKDVRV